MFRWYGYGILDKPIGDFTEGYYRNKQGSPYFAGNTAGSISIRVTRDVIPEPEEYALTFGLFALGFVFPPSTKETLTNRRYQQIVIQRG